MNEQNGNGNRKIEHIPGLPPGAPQDRDYLTAVVDKMVGQHGALLRQQLDHEARQFPLQYDKGRIDQLIRDFQANSADIKAAIIERVKSRLLAHVHQDLRRVLADVIGDAPHALPAPPWHQNDPTPTPPPHAGPLRLRAWPHQPLAQQVPLINGQQRPRENAISEQPPEPFSGPVPATQALGKNETPETREVPPAESEDRNPADGRPMPSANELYRATVMLRVEAKDSLRQMIRSIEALRQKPDLRLVQLVGSILVGNIKEGVDIWLGLRTPVPLTEILLDIEGVSQAEGSPVLDGKGGESLLKVRLAGMPSLN